MRVIELPLWQAYCTTTGTCCLTRYITKYALVGLLVVLWHFETLCFIHRFRAKNSSLQIGHSYRSIRNLSYIRNCVQAVLLFSRDVCSPRAPQSHPHLPDSGRSLPVPEHAIQSRAVRAMSPLPGHAAPFSKSPLDLPLQDCGISQ